jgi:hypothetical protein
MVVVEALVKVKLRTLRLRNWCRLPVLGPFSLSYFSSNGNISEKTWLECIPYAELKMYFAELHMMCFNDVNGYLCPRHDTDMDWFGFGVFLANVGALGCHYLWPQPLDPLLWAAIHHDPDEKVSMDDIEQYFLEVEPVAVLETRVRAVKSFQSSLEDCVTDYHKALLLMWKKHMQKYLSV